MSYEFLFHQIAFACIVPVPSLLLFYTHCVCFCDHRLSFLPCAQPCPPRGSTLRHVWAGSHAAAAFQQGATRHSCLDFSACKKIAPRACLAPKLATYTFPAINGGRQVCLCAGCIVKNALHFLSSASVCTRNKCVAWGEGEW